MRSHRRLRPTWHRFAVGGVVRPGPAPDDDRVPAILSRSMCCPIHMADPQPPAQGLERLLQAARKLRGVPYVWRGGWH